MEELKLNSDLKGVGFSNYRSIGKEPVFLYPLSRINLFVGPNNCGKSNILRFIRYNHRLSLKSNINLSDKPNYDDSAELIIYYPVLDEYFNQLLIPEYIKDWFILLLKSDLFHATENILWAPKDLPDLNKIVANIPFHPSEIEYVAKTFTGSCDNDVLSNVKRIIYKFFLRCERTYNFCKWPDQSIYYIEASRDLYDHNKNSFLDNNTIINKLFEMINHDANDSKSKKDIIKINNFVSDLIGRDVQLIIPHDLKSIDLRYLKEGEGEYEQYGLDHLGSGIHEIIYFAVACTVCHNAIICIDEPEIHMHPSLQRKFLEYISENTDNQYFIATHSASFLNTNCKNISIFMVSKEKTEFTKCSYVSSQYELSNLVDLLGCKASDILQSNCIIWVEGPSDRLYINYWIQGRDKRYKEGVHYSIMFYGGKLLSHLTTSESDNNDLIKLMSINRNSYIVIDSDKRKASDDINETKKRIRKEFKSYCWITEGREIENYINNDQYFKVLSYFLPNSKPKNNKFDNRLKLNNSKSVISKVDFAKELIVKYPEPNYDQFDLSNRIDNLISFIDKANQ